MEVVVAEEEHKIMSSIRYIGSCVCGQTTYEAFDLADVSYCHCQQCRKMSGHFMAACQADRNKITISGKVKWHYTHESEGSRHGFCNNCGAHMFWQNDNRNTISVTAGTLEDSKELQTWHHIFTEEKGCYYEIDTNEPQSEGYGDSNVEENNNRG